MSGTLLLLAGLALPLACGDDQDPPSYPDVCDDPNVSCDGSPGTAARGGVGGRGRSGGKGGTGGAPRVTGGSGTHQDGSNRNDDAGADSGS